MSTFRSDSGASPKEYLMYAESDYIMLSALQHYLYCPRQCALIHIEQVWAENKYKGGLFATPSLLNCLTDPIPHRYL
jgi:hypothetical protein